jgi:DNA end-binding protein Ku
MMAQRGDTMASTIRNSVIEFGTLAVPVALKKITARGDVRFDRACKDGAAVKRLEVNENTGETVANGDIVKGVRDGDTFYEIPAAAIEQIDAATKLDSFAIEGFVPLDEVPWERVTDTYYLAPVKGQSSRKALRLLLDAMKPVPAKGRGKDKIEGRGGRAGVFKLMPRTLQHLAVVYPKGDGLFVSTLAWAEDFRQADEAAASLADVATDERALEMARQLIDAYTEPVELLDSLSDDVREKRAELIAQAATGQPIEVPEAEEPKASSDDLMAALEASLQNRKRKAAVTG